MTNAAPPKTSERVIFPPGTNGGKFGVRVDSEYLSDQDIAAGRSPKSTKTTKSQTHESNKSFRSVLNKRLDGH